MLTNKLTSLVLLLSITPIWAALASGGMGDGGDAVVCPDSVVLLDSYEARKMRLSPELGSGRTIRSMVTTAVMRLQKKDIVLAEKLYQYSVEMVDDIEKLQIQPESRGDVLYIGNDVIAEINDSAHVSIPHGCELRQLVSQREPKHRFEYRYEIDQTLWDKMNTLEQAMTVLHEAWYRIMIENGAENSRSARYMNALTAFAGFESEAFPKYIEDLRNTEIKNYTVINNSSTIIEDNIVINIQNSSLQLHEQKVCAPNTTIKVNFKTYILKPKLIDIKFLNFCFKNSRVNELSFSKKLAEKDFNIVMENYRLTLNGMKGEGLATLKYHDNGALKGSDNIIFSTIYKMYYVCNGIRTFSKARGCFGPYLHKPSVIHSPKTVEFNEDEQPIGLEFPPRL